MKRLRLEQGFYILLAATVMFLAAAAVLSWQDIVPVNGESCRYITEDWTYSAPDGETRQLTLPARIAAEPYGTDRITHRLTAEDLAEGTTLRVRSSQQSLRVLLEGEEIYRFGDELPLAFLHSPGCSYHFLRLEESAAGKQLTLEFSSSYPHYAGYFNEVAAGTKNALFFDIFEREWFKVLICGAIGLIGLGLICSYIFFRRRQVQITKSALYLGISAMGIGLWSLTETRLFEFMLPNPTLVYLLTFLSLMLIPYPMLLFIQANYAVLSEKNCRRLGLLLLAAAALTLLLQLTGTMDLMETLPLSHMAVGVVCLVFAAALIKDCRRRRQLTMLAKGLILLMVCVIIDMVRFYGGGLYHDSAAAMRVGMLIFMAILGYDVVDRMYRLMEQAMESKALERLAYLDALTGCRNRMAFERQMNEIESHWERYPQVEVVMFDLNDFKYFNDHYGHQAGDQVLMVAAQCLTQAFADCGTCYRIGGDEFMIIAPEGIDRFQERSAQLERLLSQMGQPYPIRLSCGRAGFAADAAHDIWAIYQLADERMYEHKQQAKAGRFSDDDHKRR